MADSTTIPAPPAPAPSPARVRPETPGGVMSPSKRAGWGQTLGPFVTSLLVHLGLIGLAVLIASSVPAVRRALEREQVIIPDATMLDGLEIGAIPNPGLDADPDRATMQDLDAAVRQSDAWNTAASESLTSALAADPAAEAGGSLALGPSAAVTSGPGGGEAGGRLAPFGTPGGGGGLSAVGFMGIPGSSNVREIVYVCDASGSMDSRKMLLFEELRKSVDRLSPAQFFNIVFFQDGDAAAFNRRGLVPANVTNKRRLGDFLTQEVRFRFGSDPLAGLRLAFQNKPQLIFLLTDGDFAPSGVRDEQILALLNDLNPQRQTKINTIAFASPGQRDEPFVDFLRTIAEEHGGTFRFVTEQDL